MAKQMASRTDFDDEPTELNTAPLPAVGVNETGTPYCAKHHCKMERVSGGNAGSKVDYHKCPVDGCEERAKRVKSLSLLTRQKPSTVSSCSTSMASMIKDASVEFLPLV